MMNEPVQQQAQTNSLQKIEQEAEDFVEHIPDIAHDVADPTAKTVLVPKNITIGLAIFAVILGLSGFGFRLAMGEKFADILPNLLLTTAIFWVFIPVFFVVGSKVLNRFSGKPPIQTRNALTLGLLFTCVAMLWLMSAYS